MRDSRTKALLWRGVAVLCYFVATLLFLVVALDVFSTSPGQDPGFSRVHFLYLGVSTVLFTVGRVVTWKFGRDPSASFGPPERSRLSELGYRVPPDPGEVDRSVAYRDGQLYVVCGECSAENDPEFTYCRACSSELPDPDALE